MICNLLGIPHYFKLVAIRKDGPGLQIMALGGTPKDGPVPGPSFELPKASLIGVEPESQTRCSNTHENPLVQIHLLRLTD